MEATEEINQYFTQIEEEISKCYEVAGKARKKGFDPEEKVDIPLARGISQRVEGLISAVAPQILKSGLAERIEKLEKEFGSLDWRVALKIAEEVAKQKFCSFSDEREAMEVAIRVGLAYATLGVIAAPLEGFIELKIKNTVQQKRYLSLFFAGPIRAAGGTAAALTVLIADYVREKMGYEKYDPKEDEIKRYVTEVYDYHERATNLQYLPSEEEITFLIKNLPLEINGDPTERIEVSNYKDIPRIETNLIRGGMCLVLAEGIAQKAPKLHKQISVWGGEMGLDWGFFKEFLEIQKVVKAKGKIKKDKTTQKITPDYTYIKDLVAGRPVLSHPLKIGGFRIRYGRTRTSGFAATAIHPATMRVLSNYIATGTQLKVERPGKATVLSPCDYLDGPIVRLKNGNVLKIDSEEEIKEVIKEVEKILFLGDILVNYGDFSENGHSLVPVGYCEEWWGQELEKAVVSTFGTLDYEKLAEFVDITSDNLQRLIRNPIKTNITARAAFNISEKFKVALHPKYTYFWNNLSKEEFVSLFEFKRNFNIKKENDNFEKIIIPFDESIKLYLEKIGLPHLLASNEFIVVKKHDAESLYRTLGQSKEVVDENVLEESKNTLDLINQLSSVVVKDKLGTFIGARMGRPEKAKERELTGSPHVLFPVSEEGGRFRSIQSAMEAGKVSAEFPLYRCDVCKTQTIFGVCERCGEKTKKLYQCRICGLTEKKCSKKTKDSQHVVYSYKHQEIDIKHYFKSVLEKSGLKSYPDLIKGVRGTSNKERVPEHLLKGILRAKHKIHVNKDGTTRYDMIEMPITHFKPKEIGTPVSVLKNLGYKKDIKGKELESDDQIIEIFSQDLILPDSPDSPDEYASSVLIRVCQFIDELLVRLYGGKEYYNVKTREDLIGNIVVGLAPHTSAGMVGRIIGFSKTQGMYAHPMFHAAMRRNCDGDEACVVMLLDAALNFSRKYLPDKRGSRTMDAPLVLTSILVPSEVDDEVHGMDITWKYPLELYEASQSHKNPWEVKVKQIGNVIGSVAQYEGMGYTHDTSDINSGVRCSAYKTLPSMQEKLQGQMLLAERIEAVDETDVARLVIEKHFMKDIKGNLRKYSLQVFRCVKCNEKFRRPPLVGVCTKCRGRIIFTISEGSVVKYLEPAISLAKKYDVSPYLKQSLELVKRRVEEVFGKDPEIQTGLGSWFE
ncbi:DNA polymerase II large subunit [Candidatus Woesearchaeota archaeon]|nr:DNA polymerase II large subunit [Candidatus Woesearchaeota archaeon]